MKNKLEGTLLILGGTAVIGLYLWICITVSS